MNAHAKYTAPLILLTMFLVACPSKKSSTPILAGIDTAIAPCINSTGVAGAVTCVATRDGIAHLQAHGFANLEARAPMRTDSIFGIASMTKPITATAILMLHDEGKLNIDDPVSKHLPEFASLKTPSGKPASITLRQLLSHTSGLGAQSPEENKIPYTLAELAPKYAALPMLSEPGEKWKYTRVGFNLSARIVEKISGLPFEVFLEKRIFAPLGMADTAYNYPDDKTSRMALVYHMPQGATTIQAYKTEPGRQRIVGSGGLSTTATDYARFCQMLLREGELNGIRILKPETVRLMRTITTGNLEAGFSPGHSWGIGVGIVREPRPDNGAAALSPGSFGHVGSNRTHAWVDPVKGAAYILLVHRTDLPGNYDNIDIRKQFQQAASDALSK